MNHQIRKLLALIVVLGVMCVPTAANAANDIYPVANPKGIVLMAHGGGWLPEASSLAHRMGSQATFFNAQGWTVVSVDYQPGLLSNYDFANQYDIARAHTSLPICLYGESAGGQIVLMVAAARHPSCTISLVGPTDLERMAPVCQHFPDNAFRSQKATYSPIHYPFNGPVVAAFLKNDTCVPLDTQGQPLADEHRANVTTLFLDPDPALPPPAVGSHGNTTTEEAQRLAQAYKTVLHAAEGHPAS